ncbi:glycosyltransferase [Maridesulfovibrio ferrireducens]|uniref:glycosyltransferase n=1 Tax=Maridesulfovibrio ferrireducens TaxID=246191 RepID=UPI001A345008|nr:glycosyltransferase [Maridesulfovibrio ferrireducens]MBI9111928.1 hypothetical protein [Maridesulfovibrio ferrireducens]
MEFSHFVITRFNVNIYPKDFSARLEETWLSLRLDYFQRFCFPSICAQENQDFKWLVLFDEKTPQLYRKLIQAYSKYPNFIPLFCGEYSTILSQVKACMQDMAPDANWLLTTRLDSDDALATGFFKALHNIAGSLNESHLGESETLYINFPKGLQYFEGNFYDFEDITNAFVSLIERPADPHTVFWVDHPAIYDVSPVMQVQTRPLWLQNVHETNVYNYVRGKLLERPDFSKDFKCSFDDN